MSKWDSEVLRKRKCSWRDDDSISGIAPQRKRRCIVSAFDTTIDDASERPLKRMVREDYTVAIIVPLALELAPIRAFLTEIHADLPTARSFNAYTLGEIDHHNIVIAILPTIGNNDSSSVATQLLNDFPNIKFGLVVGIGGGVPNEEGDTDIRLGDVVVSEAAGPYGAVIQLDRGKKVGKDRFEWTGHLNGPPPVLASAVKKLKAMHSQQGYRLGDSVLSMLCRNPNMQDYRMPDPSTDYLFRHTYEHEGSNSCHSCDKQMLVVRPFRSHSSRIHYGSVGSSNAVIKSGTEREKLRAKFSILSVEMEAAGMMNVLPCLTIRGICDYSDSHKNKRWQPYAAAVAAAYMKELLSVIPPVRMETEQKSNTEVTNPWLDALLSERFDEPKVILRALFKSLDFHRMDARLNNIEEAYPQTCRWIFQDDLFRIWIDRDRFSENHGIFWIKGKPGSGKSTVMKTIVGWVNEHHPDQIALSYFFNARAHGELEKSTMGLYRSLTYQLLNKAKDLRISFLRQFGSKYHSKQTTKTGMEGISAEPPVIDEWTEVELKNFLASVMKLSNYSLNVFIDALDEGDESDIRKLVTFLETIASSVPENDSHLRICLSSRHYPEVRIKRALSLVMEDHPGHCADIETYVEEKLDNELDIGVDGLRTKICEKSAMVFLWIVLVIPMLQQAYDKGRIAEMARCLEELPQDLENLFQEILSRDTKNIDQCYSLLYWVAYAQRPLDQRELYIATHFASQGASNKDEILHSESALNRYLLDMSRGLVEMTSDEPIAIQLVHDTVRTFLQQHGTIEATADDSLPFEGRLQNRLSSICLRYLLKSISDLEILPQPSTTRRDAYEGFGFLEYATTYIFEHAEIARGYGIQQNALLAVAASFKFHQNWANAIDWCSYGHASYHEFGGRRTLLCWLVERQCINLVRDLFSLASARDLVRENIKYAIIEAASQGFSHMLRILLNGGASCGLKPRDYNRALILANSLHYEEIVALLVGEGADVNAKDGTKDRSNLLWRVSVLKSGTKESIEQMRVMIKYGADLEWDSPKYGTALHEAVSLGSYSMVQLLLQHGANVNAGGSSRGPVLLHALTTKESSTSIISLLRSYGADFGVLGGPLQSIIQAAASGGNVEKMKMILATGVDVSVRGGADGNALHAAAAAGHVEVVKLLLNAGADVNSGDSKGRSALHLAASRGHNEVVSVLIGSGADVNVRDDPHENILCGAIREADIGMLKLLLSCGNYTVPQGEDLCNAIQLAVSKGEAEVMHILLSHGGYVNIDAQIWSSALSAAADAAQYRIGHMLSGFGSQPWVFPESDDDDDSSSGEEEDMVREQWCIRG